jgi:hypothetical protein
MPQLAKQELRRISFFTICLLVFLSTIFPVSSQPSFFEDEIILGVRTLVPPVTRFCQAFGENLSEKVAPLTVKKVPILNVYKGEYYSRYSGLRKPISDRNHIDIECGPNSITSSDLAESISFSDPFHTTGIKLLLPEELAQQLTDSSPSNLADQLGKISIGVFEGTTTLEQFQDNEPLYKFVPIGPLKDPSVPNDPSKGTNALERAISALESGGSLGEGKKIDALASDGIILQSILKFGLEDSGEFGEIAYIRRRGPLAGQGFAVFPSEAFPSPDYRPYLPGFGLEQYAIAIAKGSPNEDWLSEVIDASLSEIDNPNSNLSEAKNALKRYEVGVETVEPLPTPTPEPDSVPDPGPNSDRDPQLIDFLPIIVAAIAALGSIVVAILNPELVRTLLSSLKGSRASKVAEVAISGRVLDAKTGAWIRGAKVSLDGSSSVEHTDAEGHFELLFQTDHSSIRIRVDADGYDMFDRRIKVSEAIKFQDIRLTPE